MHLLLAFDGHINRKAISVPVEHILHTHLVDPIAEARERDGADSLPLPRSQPHTMSSSSCSALPLPRYNMAMLMGVR